METFSYQNFADCSETELVMILKWRNSESVRFNSYNDDIISLQNHLKFIETLGGGNFKNRYYFLISDNLGYVGVLSFTNIAKNSAEIGYYKNPERTEKGIGVKLLNFASVLGKNLLKLEELVTTAFDFNAASLKSIERSGFTLQKDKAKSFFIERTRNTAQLLTYKCKL